MMVMRRCISAVESFADAKRSLLLSLVLPVICVSTCSPQTRRLIRPAPCRPPVQYLLDVPYSQQQLGNWCWAAAGEMVMKYHTVNVTQCQQASDLTRLSCCAVSLPDRCNVTGWPDFKRYGFTMSPPTRNAALSWTDVRDQIYCKGLPFTFSWHFDTGGGHIYVAIGFQTKEGIDYVELHDPQPYNPLSVISGDHAIIPYDVYNKGFPGTSHWDDYYNIKKR